MNRPDHASGEGFRRLAASARRAAEMPEELIDLRRAPWKAPYPIRNRRAYRRYLWSQIQNGQISREHLAATEQKRLVHDDQAYPDVIRKAAVWVKHGRAASRRPGRAPRFPVCSRR